MNVLAREYADEARPKRIKPVILSHPMMPGLLQVWKEARCWRRGKGCYCCVLLERRAGLCCTSTSFLSPAHPPPNYPQLPPHTPHNHPLDRAKRR